MGQQPESRPRGPEDQLPRGGFECVAEKVGVRYELLVHYKTDQLESHKVWLVIRVRDTGECITTLKGWP